MLYHHRLRFGGHRQLRLRGARLLHHMRIGVLREPGNEKRVSIVPSNVEKLVARGTQVFVEQGAGKDAFADQAYEKAGAIIAKDPCIDTNVLTCIHPSDRLAISNATIIGTLRPHAHENRQLMENLKSQGTTCFSLDQLLRTLSRGQAFDVLSSQANLLGYRAIIEASQRMQRPFSAQTTAAGNLPPVRTLVIGAGVAGLSSIQTARALGSVVTGFDVRTAAAEQVEAVGGRFLHVQSDEDGSATGGYAKEMSDEWFELARQALLKECAKTDLIITTAQIPGKSAPQLITKDMIEAMPPNSLVIDLAADSGGNVEGTVLGSAIAYDGTTIWGPSQQEILGNMAHTASTLFGNNVTNFILSLHDINEDEVRNKDKKAMLPYAVDLDKDAVARSMCILHQGKVLPPYVPPPTPTPTPTPTQAPQATQTPSDQSKEDPSPDISTLVSPPTFSTSTVNTALATAGVSSAMAIGSVIPGSGMSTMMLSTWLGSGAVRNVSHTLHSPLMSVTNAISGMTIVGGMLQLNGAFPTTIPDYLAASAVGLSAINLVGGFAISNKMVDMFGSNSKGHLALVPFAVAGSGYLGAAALGFGGETLTQSAALLSGLGCIGSISALSNQETARAGVYAGMGSVGLGLAATSVTMSTMDLLPGTAYQLAALGTAGGIAGKLISDRVSVTQLPQAVAGFHALVGLAAISTAVGDYLNLSPDAHLDAFHATSIYAGSWLGGITFAGSVVAAGKLAELIPSAPKSLPGKNMVNSTLAMGSCAGLVGFACLPEPLAHSALFGGLACSAGLGTHMTMGIGGADMPVVITLLNSYSGWALAAEGFLLNQPLLTIVGSLIGSSGAYLTKVMCDGMNRNLSSVILGGNATSTSSTLGTPDHQGTLIHHETTVDETRDLLTAAKKVAIIPGYGLAVAKAQTAVNDIGQKLRDQGIDVKYGVHPVAGRMPGQLNLLLAEAGVPYEDVLDLEQMNEQMDDVDVLMVIGANDTVNSMADDPNSDIGGMPVIRVWNAKQVIFVKRSMASGYAGISNPVFYNDNTKMLLGDAKTVCDDLTNKL